MKLKYGIISMQMLIILENFHKKNFQKSQWSLRNNNIWWYTSAVDNRSLKQLFLEKNKMYKNF